MSRLNKLIAELCPNGVEYVALANVLKTNNAASSVSKKDYQEIGSIPVIDQSQAYIAAYTDNEAAVPPVLPCIVFGDHTRVVKYAEQKFAQGDSGTKVFIPVNESICTKYVYYAFCNLDIPSRGYNRHWTIAKEMKIPLPPLAVQQEIVRILDQFTELTEQLNDVLAAELYARKLQYEHYRKMLFTFGDKVPQVKLEDIAEFKYGFTDTAKDKGTARFIRITDIEDDGKLSQAECKYIDLSSESKQYLLQKGDLLMARTGATYGKTMLFNEDIPAVYASFLIRIRFPEQNVLPAYYWHFAQSSLYWNQANKLVSKAGQPQFNANALKNVIIPVPPLEEQKRIVEMLDKLDTLYSELINSLPKQIAAQQKQYEFYRDKLFSFKEVSA